MATKQKYFALFVTLPLAMTGFALTGSRVQAEDCLPNTPSEKIYCQLKADGHSGELPNFNDFRKNPASTQLLLLQRPAKKYGIVLPAPPAPSKPTVTQPPTTKKPLETPGVATQAQPSIAAQTPNATPRIAKPAAAGNLAGCVLQGEIIQCAAQRFQLQFNQPNSHLKPGALTATNQLRFPPSPGNTQQAADFLVRSYTVYIDKMLDIGLGASTLTFNKFVGIYQEVTRQNVDFSARFSQMYSYLQQDKTKMNPPKRFTQALPQTLANCQTWSNRLIVCDDASINWVYQLTQQ